MSSNSAGDDLDHPINDMNVPSEGISTSNIPVGATCRICRGEATTENPLFHPCKCKGSIKYLHEPCLLEWISARNLDVNTPGSVIKCDICHYPFLFKTKYKENMPEKIPMSALFKNSILNLWSRVYSTLLISIAINLLAFGIPLIWNFYGRCFTMLLDGCLPYEGQFWKSILLGYKSKYFNDLETFDYSLISIALTLFENAKFSAIQIALTIILHLALYFQYDMIVREDVFTKMVFHKIGPNFSVENMKNRLKTTFPGMNDEMLDQVATMMNDREKLEHEAKLDEEERAYNRQFDMPEEPTIQNDIAPSSDESIIEENNGLESASNNDNDLANDNDAEVGNDTHDPDYVLPNEDTVELDYDSDENTFDFNNHAVHQDEIDELREEREQAVRNIAEVAEENNNQADDLAVPLVRPVRPPQPVQQIPEPQQDANENIDAEEIINELQGNQNNVDQFAPFLMNIKLKLTNLLIYTLGAFVIIGFYIFIAYYIPTVIGYGLIYIYSSVIGIFIHGLLSLIFLCNIDKIFVTFLTKIPHSNEGISLFVSHVVQPVVAYYQDYKNNSLQTSLFIRSVPALTTYLTAVTIICISAGYICKGYNRRNGMNNNTKRLFFQILYAIRCTFKVFTLFFIELAGFPIMAGVMLDLSLIAPVLGTNTTWLWIPKICWFWTKGSLIIYWMVGTLYMYWFAKYIGMIRRYIIRPGVLFFIRSPDDPNIKILHDSLIHPMGIQLSRLCLSMFIYAVFILAGFGVHTRLVFPLLFSNNFINTYEPFSTVNFKNVSTMLLVFYMAKIIIDDNNNITTLVRDYWIMMFQIISRKSRLSSFILGKDYALERGHVLYRNFFYKFFAPKTAQWSNPDLFSNPKTENTARQLFKENNMIHAYFIPDGMLMRVPSSDIVSRNYVQTMFVPVTKNDKLLKPLDLKKMKERNQRNAGEFAYLDHQNTEYDDYFVCYVPPNFKFRYMSLIFLTWLFASLLILGVAVVSQYIFNTLTIIVLPILWVLKMDEELDSFMTIFLDSYKNANLQYVCLGAIILSSCIDYYKNHQLSRFFTREHIIDHNEINEDHVGENAENDNEDLPVGNQRGPLDILLQSWVARIMTASVFVVVSRIINIMFVFLGVYMLLFSVGYWILQVNSYILGTKYNQYSFDQVKFIDNVIQYGSHITIAYFVIEANPSAIGRLANHNPSTIIKIMWRSRLKSGLKSLLLLGFFLTCTMGTCVFSEYYFNKNTFYSLSEAASFLNINAFKSGSFPITGTTNIHFIIISILNFMVLSRHFINKIKSWFGEATQHVKDQVYSDGRSLENYGSEPLTEA